MSKRHEWLNARQEARIWKIAIRTRIECFADRILIHGGRFVIERPGGNRKHPALARRFQGRVLRSGNLAREFRDAE